MSKIILFPFLSPFTDYLVKSMSETTNQQRTFKAAEILKPKSTMKNMTVPPYTTWWLVEMSCSQKCAKFVNRWGPATKLQSYVIYLIMTSTTQGIKLWENHGCVLLGT